MINAIIFGILQGILEWLPISSQGNLVILMVGLLGFSPADATNYAVFLHAGTLLAAIVYFRKEIWNLVLNLKKYKFSGESSENRTTTFLILSTFVTGMIGYPIYRFVQSQRFAGEVFIAFVGAALIATGLIQRFAHKKSFNSEKHLSWKDGLILGVAQAFSAIPGISRSGITTSTLLFRNYKAQTALKLSFIMSIPVIFGAEVGLGLIDGLGSLELSSVFVGCVFAFLAGLISIHAMIKIAEKVKFWKFCIGIGIVAILPVLFYLI